MLWNLVVCCVCHSSVVALEGLIIVFEGTEAELEVKMKIEINCDRCKQYRQHAFQRIFKIKNT